ncbi:MAG: DUF6090 family protein [Cyclobacteriaceae bacterium]
MVIIGITIAFQLNSWKEGRDNRKLERQYLESLLHDLDQDIERLEFAIDTMEYQTKMINGMIRSIIYKDFTNDSLFNYFLGIYQYQSFISNDNTYQSMVTSGKFENIQSFDLRKQIIDLYNTNYSEIKILQDYQRDKFLYHINPYIDKNVTFGRDGLSSTEFMKTNEFINYTFSSQYFATQKKDSYMRCLEKCRSLQSEINEYLN